MSDEFTGDNISKYYYEYVRHVTPCRQECHDLEEAVGCAWDDLETGDAWPRKILNGQAVMWEQIGPMQTRDSLTAFAKANGVPEYKAGGALAFDDDSHDSGGNTLWDNPV